MFGDVKYYREGGSIPAMALFKEHLGIYMTCFSFGLPDDSIHAPNERCASGSYPFRITAGWHDCSSTGHSCADRWCCALPAASA